MNVEEIYLYYFYVNLGYKILDDCYYEEQFYISYWWVNRNVFLVRNRNAMSSLFENAIVTKKCMRMDNEIDIIILQVLQLERMIAKMSIQILCKY